ncbi:iron-sulfur cluster-binding domain-containing protein [Frigidibacter sp. MR17.14]|uniref:flavin reductase family protein n=1 Tax=Frigidibacter sp. MR17.14 TaxID=3126509 RepID=UPI003012AF08
MLELTCTAVRDETPTVKTFSFASTAPVTFEPGQAVALGVDHGGATAWRSFSISGRAPGGGIEMTIKAQAPGGVTAGLHAGLKPGMTVTARPPRGGFTLALRSGAPLALVSAGSGATPLVAMLRHLAQTDPGADVLWVHAARDEAEILFAAEIARLQQLMPRLEARVVLSRPGRGWLGFRGRVTRRLMSVMAPDLAARELFCCGPAAFMSELRRIHRAEGAPAGQFHCESFGAAMAPAPAAPPEPAGAGAAPLHSLQVNARRLGVRAGETVLQASLRQGVIIPCGCGEGQCGTCMVSLTSGRVEMRHQGGITAEEEAAGRILACSSRPLSDIEIRLD